MPNPTLPPKVQNAVNALLHNPGKCTPELRQSIEAYAAHLAGASRPPASVPSQLLPYIVKVVLHAYRITHEDVEQLKASGYSEDEIFEITLCASTGASLARLERGLQALHGAPHAPTNS